MTAYWIHFLLNIQPVVVFCLITFHSHSSVLNIIQIVVNFISALIRGSQTCPANQNPPAFSHKAGFHNTACRTNGCFLPPGTETDLHKALMQQHQRTDSHPGYPAPPRWASIFPYNTTPRVRVHTLQCIWCPLWPYFTVTCWSFKSIAIMSWNINPPSLLCCCYHKPNGSQPLWGPKPCARCTGWTFTLWAAVLLHGWTWDFLFFFQYLIN